MTENNRNTADIHILQLKSSLKDIYPVTYTSAVYDDRTGANLTALLHQFNNIHLPYAGTSFATRNQLPEEQRRKGIIISYVDLDGNTIIEQCVADKSILDEYWGLDENWRKLGDVILSGELSVSSNGTWVINGEETNVKAVGPKGDNGATPMLKTINNKLHYSYDGIDWIETSENIAAWFRWNATTADTQANNLGRLQISRDNKTWTNLSGDIVNNLHISRYIGADESLPTSGITEGTIYAKGPYYDEGDTLNDNPIYRLWVYAWKGDTLAWQDNGEFTSIAAGVVQETGESETEVMSQKAVTEKLSELGSEIDYNNMAFQINDISYIEVRSIDVEEEHDGVVFEIGSMEIRFKLTTIIYPIYAPSQFKNKKVKGDRGKSYYLHRTDKLYMYINKELPSSEYHTFVVASSSLNTDEYILFANNYRGTLVDCPLSRALSDYQRIIKLNVSDYQAYNTYFPIDYGWMKADGSIHRNANKCITDYFYARKGSVIYNVYNSTSQTGNIAFYDQYLNIISVITSNSDNTISLDDTNIPADAMFFRACVNKSSGKVFGIIAEGVTERAKSKDWIILHHDGGKIPEFVYGESRESIIVRYPYQSKIYINYSSGGYVYDTSSITVSIGDIEIPRYSRLYIDTINARYAVRSSSFVIEETDENYWFDEKRGLGALLVNNVAYYKDKLPNGEFLLVLVNGVNNVTGVLLDSVIDNRIRMSEKKIKELELSPIDTTSIFSLNPSSEYDMYMINANNGVHIDFINGVTGVKPISLLWLTDLHANGTNLQRIIQWKEKYHVYIDDMICTGDQQLNNYIESFDWWDANGATPILQVIGNHDAWIPKSSYQTGEYNDIVDYGYGSFDGTYYNFYIVNGKACYDKYLKGRVEDWGVVQPSEAESVGKNYYYKDYDSRIRMVVLDAKHYNRGEDKLSDGTSTQNIWFKSVLEDARINNLSVVVASHYYPNVITPIDCSYNGDSLGSEYSDKLNSMATTSVSEFIDKGGTFITWLVGHTHYDAIGYNIGDERQLVTCNGASDNTRNSYITRPTGTKAQDNFNVISFDTELKRINIVKVGSDVNTDNTRKRLLSYQYQDRIDEFGKEHKTGIIFCY